MQRNSGIPSIDNLSSSWCASEWGELVQRVSHIHFVLEPFPESTGELPGSLHIALCFGGATVLPMTSIPGRLLSTEAAD